MSREITMYMFVYLVLLGRKALPSPQHRVLAFKVSGLGRVCDDVVLQS